MGIDKTLKEPTREFVDKLSKTESKVLEFDRMLELLEMDLRTIDMEYKINYAIDYSEIHRYLHPLLDRKRRTDPSRYRLEQMHACIRV